MMFQLPPTPTPFPDYYEAGTRAAHASAMTQQLQLTDLIDFWEMAPEIVGLWNMFSDYTVAFQWIIFAAVIIAMLSIAFLTIKKFVDSDDL
jgi:hypothetical protein